MCEEERGGNYPQKRTLTGTVRSLMLVFSMLQLGATREAPEEVTLDRAAFNEAPGESSDDDDGHACPLVWLILVVGILLGMAACWCLEKLVGKSKPKLKSKGCQTELNFVDLARGSDHPTIQQRTKFQKSQSTVSDWDYMFEGYFFREWCGAPVARSL